jgi:hypothetical protein
MPLSPATIFASAGTLAAASERPVGREEAARVWSEVAHVAAHYGYPPPAVAKAA